MNDMNLHEHHEINDNVLKCIEANNRVTTTHHMTLKKHRNVMFGILFVQAATIVYLHLEYIHEDKDEVKVLDEATTKAIKQVQKESKSKKRSIIDEWFRYVGLLNLLKNN